MINDKSPLLISSKMLTVAEKIWKVALFGPDNFKSAVISHYIRTKKRKYKKDAIAYATELVSDYFMEEQIGMKVEDSIQLLLKYTDDIPFPAPIHPNFTFIDLFAGIGGFRIAMQKNGGECIFSSEWDKKAQETYYLNFGEIPFGDITKEETKKWIPERFDVLCAGFPCQPFSRAGVSARTYLGLEHGFDHPTQGNLFFEIMDIVKKHRPKVLFLENVKNLRSHDNGNTFKTIERMILETGYSFFSTVINSQTEVPQKRERTYMVCFRDKNIAFKFPDFNGKPKALKDILEEDVPESFTISENLWNGHINRSQRNKDRGTGFTVTLANLDKPANTLVSRYYKDGKECLISQEDKTPRMLTPRECARLQGFPENYILNKSKTASYKQFGNSVAVPVVERIAEEIAFYL